MIKSVDINNDGTLDYFLGTNSIISRFQSPSFLETQVEIPSESISTDIKDIDFYDYDFDGQLDYFFLDGSGNIFIGINDGEGGLESEIQIPLDIESADKFIIGNLNNNTTPDVIVHNGDLQLFYIPDLNPSINIELDNNSNFSAQIILDDIDNNKQLDIVYDDKVWLNDGGDNFSLISLSGQLLDHDIIDLDGDGLKDIIHVDIFSKNVWFLKNNNYKKFLTK